MCGRAATVLLAAWFLLAGWFPGGACLTHAAAPVRGITISTHRDGRDWGWDTIEPTLDRIRSLGANWVSTHPYAWISEDGTVRFPSLDDPAWSQSIQRPIAEAHRRGLKVFIKPHLGYWGSRFAWRGEISYQSEEEWDRFFASYGEWITRLAALSRKADGFCVGVELDATLSREARWRKLIAKVRRVTPAPLSYAANWSDYRRVPFWDALDVIGIQAYFPVTDTPDPDEDALRAGWEAILSELRGYSVEHDRYVLFTELGYNQSPQAAVRPWEGGRSGEAGAVALQARCLKVALQEIEVEPRVLGAFLWKWFPEPHPVGRDFQLATPLMRGVIQEVWRGSQAHSAR